MVTVLLTNAQQRKTLSAVRSLGKKGIRVIVSEETRLNPAAFSKYCSKSLRYPSPKDKPQDFLCWLKKTIVKHKCDVFFPMDDDTIKAAIDNYEELSKLCRIPVPMKDSYLIACSKDNSTKWAKVAGVDCPRTFIIKDLGELDKIDFAFPVVIKPCISSGSRGIRVAGDREELKKVYIQIHEASPYPIIQEYIGTGERYDVCLLYDKDSKLKASFVQRELRHFPIEMGPSTLQESIYSQELMDMSLRIMEGLTWQGVVELEFMRDTRDGKLKFMEINPRFWGSLEMVVLAGVDFPYLLYKVAMDEEINETHEYKTGIKCRWLLPGDILHYACNRKRRKMEPGFWSGKRHGVYDDMVSIKDPKPVLGFVLACLRYLFSIDMWRFMFKR